MHVQAHVCPMAGCLESFHTATKLQEHIQSHFNQEERRVEVSNGRTKSKSTSGIASQHEIPFSWKATEIMGKRLECLEELGIDAASHTVALIGFAVARRKRRGETELLLRWQPVGLVKNNSRDFSAGQQVEHDCLWYPDQWRTAGDAGTIYRQTARLTRATARMALALVEGK